MLAMLTLTVALRNTGTDEVQVTQNHLRATQAQLLAEAGLEAAYTKLRQDSALVVNAPASKTTLALAAPGVTLAAAGSYTVQYQKGPDPRTVMVLATGTGAAGGQKTLRVTVTTNFSPDTAILVDGKLKIHGEVQVTRECGNVHSNGDVDVDLDGKGKIERRLTGSGKKYDDHHGKNVDSGSGGNKPKKVIPTHPSRRFREPGAGRRRGGIDAGQRVLPVHEGRPRARRQQRAARRIRLARDQCEVRMCLPAGIPVSVGDQGEQPGYRRWGDDP